MLSGVAGTAGEEPVPDPAPPFVARDLGELAPLLVRAFARASRVSAARQRCALREAGRARQHVGDQHPEQEPADVRERRDAARRLREDLEYEPEPEHDDRRQPDGHEDQDDRYERQDAARGNHTMYAPITTAIAPDAPRNGAVESRLPRMWTNDATMPPPRYNTRNQNGPS